MYYKTLCIRNDAAALASSEHQSYTRFQGGLPAHLEKQLCSAFRFKIEGLGLAQCFAGDCAMPFIESGPV